MSLTNHGEDALLSLFKGAGTFYLALFTGDPGEAGSLTNEISGGGYARQAVSFGTASGGTLASSAAVEFPAATASWGTVSHWALCDAATGGNAWWHGDIAVPKDITAGDIYRIPAGSLTLTLD